MPGQHSDLGAVVRRQLADQRGEIVLETHRVLHDGDDLVLAAIADREAHVGAFHLDLVALVDAHLNGRDAELRELALDAGLLAHSASEDVVAEVLLRLLVGLGLLAGRIDEFIA